MDPRNFTERITILQQGSSVDAIGQPAAADWAEFAKVWADPRGLNGLESIKANAPTSTVKISRRIPYRTGITAGMRVLSNGVLYDIAAVLPDLKTREYVDLECVVING
ncbi:MAG TPA: phage head closure protein [Noviherbaspirillum sp.]|jgi:SPP1 family predicted phage head-tail adaptor|uniref:phage head closure protein n=1 Tax=Noviherbaspirillum sp. TaxID=1926288 RepID=UPI002DDDA7F8|nr:phage head closure protein [Noviherbaspirillum sp.]HEV2612538.1 phage head closure protein [Noviherbaspirillum sp.]